MGDTADLLPAVEVLTSLDELLNSQKYRFLEYLSSSIGTCGETGIINVEKLRSWGTTRIFIQKNSTGTVVGAALLLESKNTKNTLTIAGLCYNEQVSLAGQRILESIISTWNEDFSHFNLSVELSKQNEFIKRVAQDLGFIFDQAGSDVNWPRFVLSAHVKTDSDSKSHDTGVAIGNVPKMEPPIDSTHARSNRERIRPFHCESCDKSFTQKYSLKR
eukprot:454881_1